MKYFAKNTKGQKPQQNASTTVPAVVTNAAQWCKETKKTVSLKKTVRFAKTKSDSTPKAAAHVDGPETSDYSAAESEINVVSYISMSQIDLGLHLSDSKDKGNCVNDFPTL